MPTFKLDDIPIPFEKGDTVLMAAHRAGVDVPHYCWHPGLSVAANCRMCLVELGPPPGRKPMLLDVLRWDARKQDYVADKKPKLVPACQQQAGEGMEVKSQTSEHVAQARAAVQEMLLLNHPVDCPICDQAGECRLQDYWLEHQGTKKRMRDEPIHKPKAVPFGPTIVYDAERCIVCTRCVRVCEELAKDPVLSIRERGNLAEVVLAPGRKLDHPYSLMTEYVCPVGALTAKDFRFKARVWFLRSVPSVCVGCATGCNAYTDYDPRYQKVYRYRPRQNLAVNKHWMCDEGMLDYRRVHEGRVLEARVKGKRSAPQAAVAAAAKVLDQADAARVAVVLSAEHSQEDNFALLNLARLLKVRQKSSGQEGLEPGAFFVAGRPRGEGDDILRHPDKNPNTRGVADLLASAFTSTGRGAESADSAAPRSMSELEKELGAGAFDVVLALGSGTDQASLGGALGKAKQVIALCSHAGVFEKAASVLLPASTWAESDGTFVNAQGRAQLSRQAIVSQGASLPAWAWAAELSTALGRPVTYKKVADVRRAMQPAARDNAASQPQPGAAE